MRKTYIMCLVAGLLCACDDWTDKNFDIPETVIPDNVISKEYTLTDVDYSTISAFSIEGIADYDLAAVKTRGYLTPRTPADKVLPLLMAKKYYAASDGTSVTVTYRESAGEPEFLARIGAARKYTVSAADYTKVWGDAKTPYFTPSHSAEANLPAILKKGATNVIEGGYALATYEYSASEPVKGEEGGDFLEDFSGVTDKQDVALEGWTNYTEKGTKKSWQGKVYSGNGYVQFSANGSREDENVGWLISPAIDMSNFSEPKFTFDLTIGYFNAVCLQVLVSEDFSDDPTKATWKDVTSNFYLPRVPQSGFASGFSTAGVMDMSAYTGKINIAFKYTGSGNNRRTTTYQIDNVFVGDKLELHTTEIFKEGFQTVTPDADVNLAGWTNFTEKGTKRTWQGKSFKGDGYVQFTANGSREDENVGWLITPAITVAAGTDPLFSFDLKVAFYKADCLQVLISKDFNGDVLAANWEDVSSYFVFPKEPVTGYAETFSVAGVMGLGEYTGTVHIAFKYTGSGNNNLTTTYQVDNVSVVSYGKPQSKAVLASKSGAATETRLALYRFDGSDWLAVDSAAVVKPADYAAMGAENLYFSDEFKADDYLPAFMALRFPLVKEGTVRTAVYHYYYASAKETGIVADNYKYTGGKWVKYTQPVEEVVATCMLDKGAWFVVPEAIFREDFESLDADLQDYPGWTWLQIKGTKSWYRGAYKNNHYASCSAHNGSGVHDLWLITPGIQLPDAYDLVFSFDWEMDYYNAMTLKVLISTDFTGDETKATWVDITDQFTLPEKVDGFGVFVPAGDFDLKDYLGKKVNIAFHYEGDPDNQKTTTFKIDNLLISAKI